MSFTCNITWSTTRDPERPGYALLTGYPEGVKVYAIVQDTGDEWGWVMFTEDHVPIQIRNGYRTAELAQRGVWEWLRANPEG